jgi:hypothetical protein
MQQTPFGEPEIDIAALEARIDRLRDVIESCRKAILISRVALAAGGLWCLGFLLGFNASVIGFLLAVAASLGGIVGAGSNMTTRAQASAELAASIAERDSAIDRLELRHLQ